MKPTHHWATRLAVVKPSSTSAASIRGELFDENEEYEYIGDEEEEDGYYYADEEDDNGNDNDIVRYEEDEEYEYFEEEEENALNYEDEPQHVKHVFSHHRILPLIRHAILRPISSKATLISYNLNTLPSMLSTNFSSLSNNVSDILPSGSVVILSLVALTLLSVRSIIIFRSSTDNNEMRIKKRSKLRRLFRRKDIPNDKADKEYPKKSYSFGDYSKGYPSEETAAKALGDQDREDKLMHTLHQLLKQSQSQMAMISNIQDELGLGLELGSMKGELVALRDRSAGMERSLQTILGIGFATIYTNSDAIMERFDVLEDRFIDMENKLRYQQEILLELKNQKLDDDEVEEEYVNEDEGGYMDLDLITDNTLDQQLDI